MAALLKSSVAPKGRQRIVAILCALLAFGLLAADAAVLGRSPCLGVADIYDFWRVARPAGIEHLEPLERPGHFVLCSFEIGPAALASAPSSSALLAFLARHFSWGLQPGPELMDLRQMGWLLLAILTLLTTLALRARLSPLLIAAILYVLSDPGYLLFFNSFYADPTLFVALAGIVFWLAIRGDLNASFWTQPAWRWFTQVSVLLLLVALGGLSKMLYTLLPALTLAVLAIPMAVAWSNHKVRVGLLAGALAVLSLAAPWLFFVGPGPRFVEVNNYHAVFGGILKLTSDPKRVLRALDVPEAHWDLPRKDVFSAGVAAEHPVHEHLTPLSRTKLLQLYATDPAALNGVRLNVEGKLAMQRAHPRGNFVRNSETPRITFYQSRWQFAGLRGFLFETSYLTPWIICSLACVWLAIRLWLRQWRQLESAMFFLLGWLFSQIAIAVLGEGLINLHQHLIGARLGLDLLLVILAFALGRTILGAKRR